MNLDWGKIVEILYDAMQRLARLHIAMLAGFIVIG